MNAECSNSVQGGATKECCEGNVAAVVDSSVNIPSSDPSLTCEQASISKIADLPSQKRTENITPGRSDAAASNTDALSEDVKIDDGMEEISPGDQSMPVVGESEINSAVRTQLTEIFRPVTPVTGEKSCSEEREFPATPPRNSSIASINEAQRDSPLLCKDDGIQNSNNHMETYFRIIYLSAFAIFGTTLRVYFARLFGADCEFPVVYDFLTPLSRHICITAGGWTVQFRNAIFTDLPSNIIGCFIMGALTSLNPEIPPKFPCLRQENQPNQRFHQAFTVGLCGCLTTFAAWNGQMVRMLSGSDTDSMTRISSVVLGYAIGLLAAVASFLIGAKVFFVSDGNQDGNLNETPSTTPQPSFDIEECMPGEDTNSISPGDGATVEGTKNFSEELEPRGMQRNYRCIGSVCNWYTVPLLLVTFLLTSYLVADLALHMEFYRSMWITCLLSPPGAFLRWKLSKWNKGVSTPFQVLDWFPWGTFVANVAASILFVLLFAIQIRFLQGYEDEYPWTVAIFNGTRTGFAGSLSTVSTLAKEIVHLFVLYPRQLKSVYYTFATILIPGILSICIYIPMVGSG